MRKIAVVTRHIALLETIDPQGLTPEVASAFYKLAELILKARTGTIRPLTDIQPAINLLLKAYPEFTVKSKIARRIDVSQFSDIMYVKKMEDKNAPLNRKVIGLPPGIYYGTTANNAGEFVSLVNSFNSQFEGELHMVFNVGEVPGFEFEQLRALMIANQTSLLGALKGKPQIAEPFNNLLGSLRRAKLALPHTTIMVVSGLGKELKWVDVVGVVDFQTTGSGQFVSQRDLVKFSDTLKSRNKDIIKQEGGKVKLSDLKGKTGIMLGRPPAGWSTDRFASALRKFGVNMATDFDYNVRIVFYDPASAPADQLAEAKRRNLTLIPYRSLISNLSL